MKSKLSLGLTMMLVAMLLSFFPAASLSTPQHAAAYSVCDWAQFITDVTVPDGTSFSPGAAFQKTWRLKNIGSCTWTTAYTLVFDSSQQMGAPASVNLPSNVAPGQTVDVTVNMIAPSASGEYIGYWKFRNASGALFGIGANANQAWWVDINVSGGGYGVAYNFTSNLCQANWYNDTALLPCPGTDGSVDGFAISLQNPVLENNVPALNPGILTSPQQIYNGVVYSVYPAMTIQSGDVFQVTVGCQNGAVSCDARYILQYKTSGGYVYTLWTWEEKYDGFSYNASINLSALAGQNVSLILGVRAIGAPAGDRTLWINPSLVRAGAVPITPVPITPGAITPQPAACDRAQFIADVTVPDGTVFNPNTPFIKTWRIKNVGTCTWTTSYSLIFDSGNQMGGPASAALPNSVVPGQTVNLSINLTAPGSGGSYRGYWRFKNAGGVPFGIGGDGTKSWWVDIQVSGPNPPPPVAGTMYDFAANACSAAWYSGAGALPCPGTDGSPNGFVLKVTNPTLENGTVAASPGLVTFPQNINNGYIQGIYPSYNVKAGDRFRSIVNCAYGSTSCYVVFRLDYLVGSSSNIQTFWAFVENYEGQYYQADLDLTPLVGQNVKFVLTVLSAGSPTGDRALWVAPMIYNQTGITPGASVTTITADTPDPSAPAQPVAVNVTVGGTGASPTGTVTITGADTNCTLTLINGSGSCNVVFNTTGSKTLTAAYNGDVNYVASSASTQHTVTTIAPGASVTTITADTPDPSVPLQSVAVSVTVNGSGAAPTGTVAISGADTNCSITLSSGSGSCNVIFNSTGSKTLTATYGGSGSYTGSSSTTSHTVNNAATTTITSDIPDPSVPGQLVAVHATVGGAGATPTGTVTISGADTNCTLTLSSGSGTCSAVFNTTGAKTLTATYNGDANYAGNSVDTESHTVTKGSTTTTITDQTPNPSSPSQSVLVSVSVLGGGVTPTGTVSIGGADTNCTVTLVSGSGSCNVVFNTIGSKTLTATYNGDGNYLTSVATTVSHTVRNATTTTITADVPDPSTLGAAVTVSVTVTGAGATPTGTVAISGADSNCTLTLSSGSGSCTVVFNSAGAKVITATYNGDLNYAGSSASTNHTVIQGSTTTITIVDTPDPSAPYESVNVTVSVAGSGATPTGSVAITGADTNCTLTLTSGTGSCSVVFATSGSKTLTATYSGDGNYVGNSSTAIHTVGTSSPPPTLPPTGYKFDFGTPFSPVESGYTQVTQLTTYSSPAPGYGWTDTSALGSRDRGAPNMLERDFVQSSTAPGTFKVDLPNGTYHVVVTMGDDSNAHDHMEVTANGSVILADVSTAAGNFYVSSSISVTVTTNSLELTFSDNGGSDPTWVVNALTIMP